MCQSGAHTSCDTSHTCQRRHCCGSPSATGPAPRPELCTFLAVQHKLLLKRAAEAPAALRKRMKQQAAEVRLPPCSISVLMCPSRCARSLCWHMQQNASPPGRAAVSAMIPVAKSACYRLIMV